MLTRPRRSCVKTTTNAPELDEEKDVSVVQLSSDSDDDSTPPVLELESPIQEEHKEEVGCDLATALQNCIGAQNEEKEKVKVVKDPFPKDINLLQLLKPLVVAPTRVPLATVPRQFQVFHATREGRELQRLQNNILPARSSMAPASFIVGSNTDKGPVRILENRKREMERSAMAPVAKKPCSPLEAYNGGRPGLRFGRPLMPTGVVVMPPRLPAPTPQIEKISENQDKEILQEQQQEVISRIMKETSDDSVLLGTKVLDGLNTLNERGGAEYGKFSKELFDLMMKYGIQ
ncbi:hypothetical protein CRE_09555 [Caenorhabditis remanei]|uniref:Uncharacterized protein n=1 Tax=Caenorhabditis remanei TaxID=31234 RepID=E3MIV5_CAERE|nr:hypothetical protein CRE_09555 [Caenorhabditis remanei]